MEYTHKIDDIVVAVRTFYRIMCDIIVSSSGNTTCCYFLEDQTGRLPIAFNAPCWPGAVSLSPSPSRLHPPETLT